MLTITLDSINIMDRDGLEELQEFINRTRPAKLHKSDGSQLCEVTYHDDEELGEYAEIAVFTPYGTTVVLNDGSPGSDRTYGQLAALRFWLDD